MVLYHLQPCVRTIKSGVGVASMKVMSLEVVMKSTVPDVMDDVLGIWTPKTLVRHGEVVGL